MFPGVYTLTASNVSGNHGKWWLCPLCTENSLNGQSRCTVTMVKLGYKSPHVFKLTSYFYIYSGTLVFV